VAKKSKILVVDDDTAMREMMKLSLGKEGFDVLTAASSADALEAVASGTFDVIVTDIYLGDGTGLDLLEHCRTHLPEANVILVTAHGTIETAASARRLGVFDYLAKPFSPRELLARMKGILRRTRSLPPARAESHRLRFAGWTLDLAARHLISADGVVVPLSGTEFRLLQIFVTHPNRVLDRNQLMDLALGREATPFDRAIDVQVSRLRQRLRDDAREPRIIKTVRNGGYVLAAQVEKAA